MNDKKFLAMATGLAMSNAISTTRKENQADDYSTIAHAMFSMESLETAEDQKQALATYQTVNKGCGEFSDSLLDSLRAAVTTDLSMSGRESLSQEETDEAMARVLLGDAHVDATLKQDQGFAKLEAELKTAVRNMSETAYLYADKETMTNIVTLDYKTSDAEETAGYKYEGFSMEHFDKFDPSKSGTVAMVLSAMSSMEDPVVRINYPAHRLQPGQNEVTLRIDREFLIGNDVRKGRGTPFERNDVPMLDSYFRSDLWADNRMECIPVYSDAEAAYFMDKNLTGLFTHKDELGETFQSGILKMRNKVDLISIAGGRGEIKNRAQDRTDQLDPSFRLAKLAITVTGDDGAGGTKSEVFLLNVGHYDGAQSYQESQGGSRVMSINLSEEHVRLAKAIDLKTNATPSLLAAIEGSYNGGLVFEVQANFSKIDLTDATVRPTGDVVIAGAYQGQDFVPASDSGLTTALNGLTFSVDGFVLADLRRTDTNYTNTGMEVEVQSYTRTFKVGFSPRIQVRVPINTTDVEEARLLDGASRSRTREKVINHLENKYNRLLAGLSEEAAAKSGGVVASPEHFESRAFGNIVLLPTLYKSKYIPTAETLTHSHSQRMADLRAHLIGELRTLITHATNDSRMTTVAKHFNKGVANISVNITVDPLIHQLLMVEGDERLLTTSLPNFSIAECEADFFKGKIVVTFSAETPYDISPISNGVRLVGPSPIVKIDPDHANNAKISRTFLSTREAILDTNDVMVVMEIDRIDEIMKVEKVG